MRLLALLAALLLAGAMFIAIIGAQLAQIPKKEKKLETV